ncbi:MAG: LuxR C-terminal-related transcriptional regulator [Caulobacterales bacterium]
MLEPDKFQPPIIRTDLLRRERLESALLKSIERNALTFIVAPAGSGKSVLMSQVMQTMVNQGQRCGWLSCDHFDQDRRRFLSLLQLVVQQRQTERSDKMHLSEAWISETDPTAIIHAVAADGERYVLFLDNFHNCDNPETAAVVDALVSESGGALHVVITSRVSPHLTVGHLRLRGLVGEFDASDLAFSNAEAAELLKEHETPDATDALKRILMRTEGWAAAVQLIRILAKGGADLRALADNFSGADKDIRLFLNEEVFRTLAPATQNFLLRTAHFERFSIDLAQDVTDIKDAAAAFNDIVERNIFVVALDRSGEWIRLHSIFRDYLIAQARSRPDIDHREILRRAAEWHAAHQDWPAAIDYALKSENYALAAQLLEQTGEELVERRGETALYSSFCERLPEAALVSPVTLFWMVWAQFFSSDYDRASVLLKKHLKTMQAHPELASNASLLQFLVALFTHRFREATALGAAWLATNTHASAFNRACAAGGIAMAQYPQLLLGAARQSVEVGRDYVSRSNSIYGTGWIVAISAAISLASGRAYDARDEIEAYLANTPASHSMRDTVGNLLAEAYYELDDLDAAQKLLKRALPTIARHSSADSAFAGWRTAAFLALHRDSPRAALKVISEANTVAVRRFGHHAVTMLHLLRDELILLLDVNERRALENVSIFASDAPVGRNDWCASASERAAIIDAQRLLVSSAPRRAINAIQPIISASTAAGRLRVWAEAVCIKAVALQIEGDSDGALRIFLECVERCSQLGLRRTFLDRATLLAPLGPGLARYLEAQASGLSVSSLSLLRNLAETMRLQITPAVSNPENDGVEESAEALTTRELGILSLAAQGLPNADIAARLVIKLPTVKTHFHNIFSKLDVKNRTAAINKARAQGLLQ